MQMGLLKVFKQFCQPKPKIQAGGNALEWSRFEHLDGFRGFLAILVFLEHYQQLAQGPWVIFREIGAKAGVLGFFVLSSFLLTSRLIADLDHIDSFCSLQSILQICVIFLKYSIRRIARIYPMYLAAVYL